MLKYISIKEASVLFGVTPTTLRRWEKNFVFLPHHRTFGNHRRYELTSILKIINPNKTKILERKTICYARVSSHDQKEDLKRQEKVLKQFSDSKNYKRIESINDLGSGLNFKKKGLNKLIKDIINYKVERIIITHKDRLLRFGSDLLINIAKQFNTETIIINETNDSFEENLAKDVLEIITVFSAKLYGSRSHKNKVKLKTIN